MPQNTKKTIAFDYHGVLDSGVDVPENPIVITGAHPDEEAEIQETIDNQGQIFFFDNHEQLTEDNKNAMIGTWKAQMIKKLSVDKYYEDDPKQIEIIKAYNPNVTVVPVIDGVALEPMKFICFTFDGSILPVAYKLKQEGNEVLVGMIDNNKNVFTTEQIKNDSWKPEKPEDKKARFKLYEGMLEKQTAESLLKKMKSFKDKEEWFILGDSNNIFRFTEEAYKLGFHNGYFPTEEDRDFEENRTKAKDFVRENYPDIEVGEVEEFKTIDEAKQFLSESDGMWVLKSQGDVGDTIVPKTDDEELAKEQIISALDAHKSDYENDGFILEKYIPNPIELTPQVIFYDGEPVYYSLDIENKPMGAGNIGTQLGCAQNLVCKTKEEDEINQIAFPEVVYEMANKRHGMFIWDCSILLDEEGNKYFGEFCSNRPGWDAFPTELSMAPSLTYYFTKIMKGEDPLTKEYGAGVRILNLGKNGSVQKDSSIQQSSEKDIFIYDCYKDGELKTVGNNFDFAVVMGAGESIEDAVEEAYEQAEKITLETKYFRPQFDFLSEDYPTSIMNRYHTAIDEALIECDYADDEEDDTMEENTDNEEDFSM